MYLAAVIATAIDRLRQAEIDNPQLDARLLVGHALGLDRTQLLSQSERVLTHEEIAAIDVFLARRSTHESVARIIGKREFWGLDFGMNEATLEPRPDSETLVEAVVGLCQKKERILDLGTGTGCLLLSLLHDIPDATGLGIDINPRAVEQAAKNAVALNLHTRAEFRIGNWLNNVVGTFDIIVSNPPYIRADEIPSLMREVRGFDPMLALDGGEDGLTPYRLLIPQLKNFLSPQGLIALEFGQGQAPQVAAFLEENGFTKSVTHNDLGGITRCVTAFRPD